jgi:hypothetical protein
MEEVSNHNVTVYKTDDGYQLECVCGWDYFASKALPTKLHPERQADCFALAITDRHYIDQGIWPYTKHGKPEKNVDGEIMIIEDWPFNKN